MKLLKSTVQLLRSGKIVSRHKIALGPILLANEPMAHSSVVDSGAEVTLEKLKFINRAIKSLPVEENPDNYVRTVPGMITSCVHFYQWLSSHFKRLSKYNFKMKAH